MTLPQRSAIADLLVNNLSRDLIMGIEESLQVGAIRGHAPAVGMNTGHKPSVIGHMRHFHMTETFHDALTVGGANPSRIRGNKIVVGRAGIINIARLNVTAGARTANRSKTRREMAQVNLAVEQLVQPGLFGSEHPVTAATVFFIASFNAGQYLVAESPYSIDIAVPDHDMSGWLLREPVHRFLARYDVVDTQQDGAIPVLKTNAIDSKVDRNK